MPEKGHSAFHRNPSAMSRARTTYPGPFGRGRTRSDRVARWTGPGHSPASRSRFRCSPQVAIASLRPPGPARDLQAADRGSRRRSRRGIDPAAPDMARLPHPFAPVRDFDPRCCRNDDDIVGGRSGSALQGEIPRCWIRRKRAVESAGARRGSRSRASGDIPRQGIRRKRRTQAIRAVNGSGLRRGRPRVAAFIRESGSSGR